MVDKHRRDHKTVFLVQYRFHIVFSEFALRASHSRGELIQLRTLIIQLIVRGGCVERGATTRSSSPLLYEQQAPTRQSPCLPNCTVISALYSTRSR